MSIFDKYRAEAYPYKYAVQLDVHTLVGGIPADPKVAEGWLRTKLGDSNEEVIQAQIAEVALTRGMAAAASGTELVAATLVDEAVTEVDRLRHLNGFKYNDDLGLYIEGRQAKAMLKEASSIAAAADKIKARGWGKTNKAVKSFLAEHVFVLEDKIPLNISREEFDAEVAVGGRCGVNQRFVHTFRGTGIQYEEYVESAELYFTITTDVELTEKEWGMIWLTAERNGIGATRSQGFGTFDVIMFEPVDW